MDRLGPMREAMGPWDESPEELLAEEVEALERHRIGVQSDWRSGQQYMDENRRAFPDLYGPPEPQKEQPSQNS